MIFPDRPRWEPTLAVDPGVKTGWVLFHEPLVRPESSSEAMVYVIEWGELPWTAFLDHADQLRKEGAIRHVVCENYIPRPGQVIKFKPESLFQIGSLIWRFGEDHVHLQREAAMKSFATPAKLAPFRDVPDPIGKGGDGHALDALGHAILFASQEF